MTRLLAVCSARNRKVEQGRLFEGDVRYRHGPSSVFRSPPSLSFLPVLISSLAPSQAAIVSSIDGIGYNDELVKVPVGSDGRASLFFLLLLFPFAFPLNPSPPS